MIDVTSYITQILRNKRNYVNLRNPDLPLYKAWYAGLDKNFHNYKIYNGTNYIQCTKKTLGMAKQVCEDWASLLMNEKTDIVLPNNRKKLLDSVLSNCNFWNKANSCVEVGYALGIGAIVNRIEGLEISDNDKPIKRGKFNCDFVDADRIYPITIVNGEITECAFVNANSNSIDVQVHLLEDGTYHIYQYKLVGNTNTNMFSIDNEYTDFNTGSDIAWFHFVKPQNVNNRNLGSALGMSIFANSIDTLKAIDTKYDSFDNEFNLGRKRVYVAAEAAQISLGIDKNGVPHFAPTFDPSDTTFYKLPNSNDDKPYVSVDTSQLRVQEHVTALNQELNVLSSKCGLGENYYKFDTAGGRPVQTATAAILQQGNLFRKIKKEEIGLESFLYSFTKSLIYICNTFTDANFGEVKDDDIIITFDDSIIDDKDKQREQDRNDYNSGLMSLLEYRMKWYDEDEKTANDFIHTHLTDTLINKYMPALTSGAITPEDYVRVVYGEDEKFEERVAYITENLKTGDVMPFDPNMEI